MGRSPTREFNMEATKRIEKLKEKWGCKSDAELAQRLEIKPQQITKWKVNGFPAYVGRLIDEILGEDSKR